MANTVNIINATELYTLDWLMVNFMFRKFYLNLKKGEKKRKLHVLGRESVRQTMPQEEFVSCLWPLGTEAVDMDALCTVDAQHQSEVCARVHWFTKCVNVCVYTLGKGEPSELNFYSLILCFCNMLNLPNLPAVMKIIGTMTTIRLLWYGYY